MADLNETSGNDVIQPFGDNLVLSLNATPAAGIWPLVNVLVNGIAVLSNVSITADIHAGQTQLLSIALPAGVPITSVTLQYTNDESTLTEDRNLFVSSISLNGHALPTSSATYLREIAGQPPDIIPGQDALAWQGELRFTGSVVTNATSTAGGTLSVDGLGGIDTVLLSGTHSDWSISQNGSGYTANRLSGGETLNLTNVERLHFASGNNVALDMSAGGHALEAAEIISALFGPAAVNNATIMGIGISLLDAGVTPLQLVSAAEGTALFHSFAGSSSNADFVKLIYQNLVGSAPSTDQVNALAGLIDSGGFTQATLGLAAAELTINQAHLVGVVQGGVEFI
jgi:hypothetical protein